MFSVDVVSLFTKVPVELTIGYLEEYLEANKELISIDNCKFIKLLRLALSLNCFTCKGKYFRQLFGLSMDNPLSPVNLS